MANLFVAGHELSTMKSIGNVPPDNNGNVPLFIGANNLLTNTANFGGNNWINSIAGSPANIDSSKVTQKLDPNGNKTLLQNWSWSGYTQLLHLYQDDIVTFGAYVYVNPTIDGYLDIYVSGAKSINDFTFIQKTINHIPQRDISTPLFSFKKGQVVNWSWVNYTFKIKHEDDYYIRLETNTLTDIYIGSMIIVKSNACSSWMPSTKDIAMKSDVTSLQDQINQLKSNLGGDKSPL